jgi:hypothetical protein
MSRIACSIASLTLMIIFFGCKKEDLSSNKEDGSMSKEENSMYFRKPGKKCKVVKIVQPDPFGIADTSKFEYNQWGDPVSITRHPWPETGSPNYYFKYDKKHRLVELLGEGFVYHKYYYANPGNSEIIKDSTYSFPIFQNGVMTWYFDAAVTYYKYDNKDRIIQDSTIWSGGFKLVNNYSYDASGNRAGRTYDNKVNPHLTNDIFQFLDRDYSVNNPFVADTYNAEGLPASVNLTLQSGNYFQLVYYMRNALVTYDCK